MCSATCKVPPSLIKVYTVLLDFLVNYFLGKFVSYNLIMLLKSKFTSDF